MSKEHTYTNGEVTIIWKPDLCIHSRKCWQGLGEVFKPGQRPWIRPEGASTERIIDQVKHCPSGALSYLLNADAVDDAERATEGPGNPVSIGWFEIPVSDLERAKAFYEAVFGVELTLFVPGGGLSMALFPNSNGTAGGALCHHPKFYFPGEQGPLIHLNAEPDLQVMLDRVAAAGGEVLIPKRRISETHGYMAVLKDTEGNRLALRSAH